MQKYKLYLLDDFNGYVELQAILPDIRNSEYPLFYHIVNAARVSYLGESKGYEKDLKLLKYLWDNEHHSPFEMVKFQFNIKLPLVVQNQWVRHRMGNYNIQSYRYTEAKDEEFYIPTQWRLQDTKNKQGSIEVEPNENSRELTKDFSELIEQSVKLYKKALSYGIAREQARFFLPSYALYSSMIWGVDLRNLIHFIKLRSSDHAQYEIRQYALAIKSMLKYISPEIYGVVFGEE